MHRFIGHVGYMALFHIAARLTKLARPLFSTYKLLTPVHTARLCSGKSNICSSLLPTFAAHHTATRRYF